MQQEEEVYRLFTDNEHTSALRRMLIKTRGSFLRLKKSYYVSKAACFLHFFGWMNLLCLSNWEEVGQFLVGQTEFRVCRGDSASSDHTEVIKC